MVPSDVEPGTPKWWLHRLEDELYARRTDIDGFRALVNDDHPKPETAETSRKFQVIAGLSTTNLCGVAVEATAERMSVEGVRIGDEPDADKGFWDDVWQPSDFDAGSQDAVTAALIDGRSFVSVQPPTGDKGARLYFENASEVVLAYNPDGSRGPALKVFTDEWTGTTFGTLYIGDVLVRLQREGTPTPGMPNGVTNWIARDMGKDDPVVKNPFGVPFWELQNKALGLIRSEVAPLVIPQLRLNQAVFNTDSVSEFGAFRQKWATGIEVPTDPATGKKIAPFEAHIAKLFATEGKDARFGDFGATDMDGYIKLGQEIAAHISRISRVPITYFLSNISNLGGDALALLISGLVLKCQRRVKGYEPGLEGAARAALASMGDPRARVANIEIKWADMETRSMAQSADAAVKLTQGDNPVITPQTAQERYLGMTQTERDRDDAWRAEGRVSGNLDALLAATGEQPLPV